MRTDTIIIWYLFQFLFIQAEVHENLRHLLAKLLALMGFTSYSQVNQKRMQAGGSQDKLHLCHCVSLSTLPHLGETLVSTQRNYRDHY